MRFNEDLCSLFIDCRVSNAAWCHESNLAPSHGALCETEILFCICSVPFCDKTSAEKDSSDDFEALPAGKSFELFSRKFLVPESNGRYVVLERKIPVPAAPSESLDGYPDIFFEPHRVCYVPAV